MNYYLKKCKKHVEFTIRVQSNPLAGMFGSSTAPTTEKDPNKDYEGEYEVASESDMEWLASIL